MPDPSQRADQHSQIARTADDALRISPVFVLGQPLSGLVAVQPEHSLATNGPYRAMNGSLLTPSSASRTCGTNTVRMWRHGGSLCLSCGGQYSPFDRMTEDARFPRHL